VRNKDTFSEKIGPWKRTDIKSLAQLCEGACPSSSSPLYPIGQVTINRLMGPFVAPGVQKKMRTHTIYQWLRRELSPVLDLANAPLLEIGIVQLLLQYMTLAFAETQRSSTTRIRPDRHKRPTHPEKKRRAAERHVNIVQGYLQDGTIELGEVDHRTLERQLTLAKLSLQSRRDPEPVLLQLARDFQHQLGIQLDAKRLTEIKDALARGADVTDVGADHRRTAQRYVKKARRP
jgi:hypothetical protein